MHTYTRVQEEGGTLAKLGIGLRYRESKSEMRGIICDSVRGKRAFRTIPISGTRG